jgi:CHAT domain-containing protein/lipopolysaccharide biosynthesis regulator YciM
MEHDEQKAKELASQALDLARKSKNLWIQAYCLGELADLQMFEGERQEARKNLEEALHIDTLNHYDFETRHSLYMAWLTFLSGGNDDDAVKWATSARTGALNSEDFNYFIQSSTTLARALALKGQVDQSVVMLEQTRDGLKEDGSPLFKHQNAFLKYVAFPLNKVAILEAFAACYVVGHRPDDALRVWQELYSFATSSDFTLASAESAHGIADIYQSRKDRGSAIKWYAIAADAWGKGGNRIRQMDAMASEGFMLNQDQQRMKAVQQYQALVTLAKESKDQGREFTYRLALAEALQPGDDKDSYKKALLAAESLIPETLTITGVDPALISELYSRLATLYSSEGDQIHQIICLEKEMSPVALTKKPEIMLEVDEAVNKHLDSAHISEGAEKAYQNGDLGKALMYFELVQHFQQVDAEWRGKAYNEHYDDPLINKLIDIVMRLGSQSGGPEILETNWHDLGPISGNIRFSMAVSLTNYYARTNQPDKVIRFSSFVWPYLHLKASEHPERHDVQIACEYSLALFTKREIESAVEKVSGCLSSAEAFGDPDLLLVAHSLTVEILGKGGKSEEATKSAEYLRLHPFQSVPGLLSIATAQRVAGDWKSALETLHNALKVAESNKDQATQASILVQLANLIGLGVVSDDSSQEGYLQKAESIYAKLGDNSNAADADLQLASLFIRQRNWQRADAYLQSALRVASSAKGSELEARVRSLEGLRQLGSGDPNKAIVLFRQAAEIYHGLGDKAKESAEIRSQAGIFRNNLYKPRHALMLAREALDLAESSGDWAQRIDSLRLVAIIDESLGDYSASLSALRDALAISIKEDQTLISAYIQIQMSEGLATVGQWEESLKAVTSALPPLRQFNDRDNLFNAYAELISIYAARESALKDFDKALEYTNELKQLLGTVSPVQSAWLSLNLYEIHFQQGHFADAIKDVEAALQYYEGEKNELGKADALMSLAEALRSAGDLKKARDALTRAEPIVHLADNFYQAGRLHYGEANLYKREGHLQLATDEYEKVIGILEQYKENTGGPTGATVSEAYDYIYGEMIDTYYIRAEAEESYKTTATLKAFEMAELNKARVFTNTWGRSLIDALRQKLPQNLQEVERTIVEENTSLQNELNRPPDSGGRPKKEIEAELRKLSAQEEEFQLQLHGNYPTYADARYPSRMTISDLPLRPGEVLVEFKMFDPALFVWIVQGSDAGPKVLSFYKVHQSKDWFKERIGDIRSAMNKGDLGGFDPKVSEELFNTIFPGSVPGLLRTASSLIFIPDDILSLLPMEILSPDASKNDFFLIDTPTSYFPSAAGLRLTRSVKNSDSAWQSSFFGIADPVTTDEDDRFREASKLGVSSGSPTGLKPEVASTKVEEHQPDRDTHFTTRGYYFDRLPETAHEVENIANLFPETRANTTVRTGMEATKKTLLQTDLSKYRFLHFATHGFLPVEPGEIEPALVLSIDGTDQDQMMLKVSEISKLQIHADMVVLSACNTGSGKVTHAEGVSSLGTAFLSAGSSSVVVSLWKVSDSSTSLLMQQFYKNLLSGVPKNRALADARKYLFSQGKSHPFYWAPFVLSGD